MKYILALLVLLTAASCAAQTTVQIDDGTGKKLTQKVSPLDSPYTVKWPHYPGTSGQVLSTTGLNPDTMYWQTMSGGSTDTNHYVMTYPDGTTYLTHNKIVTNAADVVALSLEHGNALDTTDLMQFLDPSGNLMGAFTDEFGLKLTAAQNEGAAGDLLTSGGHDAAMTWTHPSALSVDTAKNADTVLNPLPYINNGWGTPQTAWFGIAEPGANSSQISNSTSTASSLNTWVPALIVNNDGPRVDTNVGIESDVSNSDTMNIALMARTQGSHTNVGLWLSDSNYNANKNWDIIGTANSWSVDALGNGSFNTATVSTVFTDTVSPSISFHVGPTGGWAPLNCSQIDLHYLGANFWNFAANGNGTIAQFTGGSGFHDTLSFAHGTFAHYNDTLPPASGIIAVTGSGGGLLTAGTGITITDTGGTTTIASSGGLTNPMTTTGDVIYSSDNLGTPARLGIGSTNNVLTVVGGLPSWQPLPSSFTIAQSITLNNLACTTVPGLSLINTTNGTGTQRSQNSPMALFQSTFQPLTAQDTEYWGIYSGSAIPIGNLWCSTTNGTGLTQSLIIANKTNSASYVPTAVFMPNSVWFPQASASNNDFELIGPAANWMQIGPVDRQGTNLGQDGLRGYGGRSTGNQVGGAFIFNSSFSGSSGAGLNNAYTLFSVTPSGATGTGTVTIGMGAASEGDAAVKLNYHNGANSTSVIGTYPAANRTYTIPDVAKDQQFSMTQEVEYDTIINVMTLIIGNNHLLWLPKPNPATDSFFYVTRVFLDCPILTGAAVPGGTTTFGGIAPTYNDLCAAVNVPASLIAYTHATIQADANGTGDRYAPGTELIWEQTGGLPTAVTWKVIVRIFGYWAPL